MSDFYRDIAISILFIAGVWGFISGQFIISTVLFGSAAMFSNIVLRNKLISKTQSVS